MKLVHLSAIAGVTVALAAAGCQSRTETGAAERAEERAQEARQEAQQARADAERSRRQVAEEQGEARAAEQARRDAEQRAQDATLRAQREEAQAREAQAHEAYAHGAARAGTTERQATRAVLFAPGSASLSDDAKRTLDEVARTIRARGEGHGVVVEGYADDTGPDAANTDLSRHRADTVADYLAGTGIARGRITTRALGSRTPAARDDSDRGRALNRRAEILIQP